MISDSTLLVGRTKLNKDLELYEQLSEFQQSRIETLANQVIIENELKELPIDLIKIVENKSWTLISFIEAKKKMGFLQDYIDFKDWGYSMMLGNKFYILYDNTISIAVQRFTNNGEIDKIYIRNNHEPIIEREVYEMVQEKISFIEQARANKYHAPCEQYPLTGKITCGCCGSKYRHRINRRIVNFDQNMWICSKQDNLGKKVCSSNVISQELLYEIILDAYNDFIDMPYTLTTNDGLNENIVDLNTRLDKLREIYIEKLITYSQYKSETERLKNARDKLMNQQKDYKILSAYQKPKTKLKEFTQEIVDKHIDNIIINGFKIEIIFKNRQKVTKEFKYEHRKYCKNY